MKRIICVLLLLAAMLASCGTAPSQSTDTTDTADTSTTPAHPSDTSADAAAVFFAFVQGGAECRIAYEDGLNPAVLDTFALICARIEALAGVKIKAVNALLPDTGVPEILVGDTGRAESREFISTLKYRDYGFIIREDYIVIAGKTQDGTIRALNKFYEYITENEPDVRDGGVGLLSTHDYLRTSAYKTADFTIDGADIGQFEIVYSAPCETAAEELAKCIAELSGVVLPCRKASAADSGAAHENKILIGNTGSARADAYYAGKRSRLSASGDYVISAGDGCLIFAGGSESAVCAAVSDYAGRLLRQTPTSVTLAGEVERGVSDLSALNVYPKTPGSDVRVMSSNVYFYHFSSKRVGLMLDSFTLLMPDVLCLQEMSAQWHRELDPELEMYGYTQVPFVPEASLGKLTPTANYTPVFYRSELFDVVASGYDQFESVRQRPDGDKSTSKSFTWAVFERRADKLRFAVISTHLTWYGEPVQAEKYRVQDANEILAAVAMIEQTYCVPVTVMGDMNTRVGADAYNTLRSGSMDTAARLALKSHDAEYNTYHELDAMPARNATMIDHIFVTKQNTTVNYYQTFVNSSVISGSDHTPVIADLTYKK